MCLVCVALLWHVGLGLCYIVDGGIGCVKLCIDIEPDDIQIKGDFLCLNRRIDDYRETW